MWVAILCTLLLGLVVVAALVPICDLPYSPYSDEFTVLQALKAAIRAELRKRRAATAQDVKVLMLGLDGSGKSSLVEYWLRGHAPSKEPEPTTGFNIQELNEPQPWWAWKGGVRLNVWELGGAAAIRPYWSRYFDDPRTGPARAVVFTVDASAPARFAEAEQVLRQTLKAGVLPEAATTLLLCFTKADALSDSSKADERRASLRAAVHEWCERQDPQDVAKKRRVHETTVSVQDSCLVGVSAAMAALQWVKKNAA